MKSQSETVLVLGASTNPSRYSYKATQLLLSYGHTPILVGRSEGDIAGIELMQTIPNENVDTVTLYIRDEYQDRYIDDIIGMNPRRVIFNPGTESTTSWQRLTSAKIECIEACTLVLLRTGQY